jgi:hypothetical protein
MRSSAAETTLGDLQQATPWIWLYCERCADTTHHWPVPCRSSAGERMHQVANASSDVLRQRTRCTACGHRGATLQHPGWGGNDVGFLPFPNARD